MPTLAEELTRYRQFMDRTISLMAWLLFLVLHLGSAVALLAAMWCWQIQPKEAAAHLSAWLGTLQGWLSSGWLGVGAIALLLGYIRGAHWVLDKLVLLYVAHERKR